MTFEEWAEQNNLSEYGKACSRAAWQAAQQAERKRLDDELTAAFMMGYQAAKNDYGRKDG